MIAKRNSLDCELDKVLGALDASDLQVSKSNRLMNYPVRKVEFEGFDKKKELTVKLEE